MLNVSTSKLKSGCVTLTVCVVAAVMVPIAMSSPAQAQDWIVNDDPGLYDEQGDYSWFTPPANINSRGYGTNGFRFTIAIGNDARHDADSWANWDMGNVNGRYEIQVWIPDAWATANAGYEIWEDSSRIDTVWLNQQDVSGWQTLGTYNLGGHLRVSVYDTVTRDDYRTVGIANARLAVDALRIRQVGRAPGPPRNLSLSLTDADSFQISWSPPSDDGGSSITGYGVAVQNVGSGDIAGWSTVGTSTSFDGVVGATYTVEVWANNSQGSGSAQRAQITIPSTGDVPGPPRNLSLTRTGSDGVRIRWSPPADDGGSRIVRYSLSTWSPDGSTNSWTTTNTVYDFRGEVGKHYTVTVVAENRHGPSIPGRESIYLEADTPSARTLDRQVTISLGANNSGSNYCPYSQLACRWVNITLTNFPAGTYLTRCVWWHSESSSERLPISRNINHGGASSANVNRLCSFNVREGRSIYVTIDGVRSNTIRFPARGSGSTSSAGSSQNGDLPPTMDEDNAGTGSADARRPGEPRDLRVELDRGGPTVSWKRPVDGGAPTSYTVTYERERLSPSIGPWEESHRVAGNITAHRRPISRGDVTYRVTVVANNAHGSSSEVIGEFTSIGQYAHSPINSIPEMQDSEKDEVPQVPGRYSRDWNKDGWGGGTGNPCGSFGGCAAKDGFWHTMITRRDDFASTYVYWDDFGSKPLRGTYSIEFYLPKQDAWKQDGSRDRFTASAIAKYTIYERQSWSDEWRVAGYFTIDQGEVEGKLDTRSLHLSMNRTERAEASFEPRGYDDRTRSYLVNGGKWALEGDVRVKLQGKNGALAADSVRLVQRDLLPIDKELAIARCQANVLNVVTKLGWIGVAVDIVVNLAGSVALSLATAGVASTLVAGGVAVQLTRGITITGKVVDFVKSLVRLLEVGQYIYGGTRSPWAVYSNIKSWVKLWEQVYLEIFEQLTGEHRKNFERFDRACYRGDGVSWSDSGQTIGLTQAFVRSGYLDYLNPDAVS